PVDQIPGIPAGVAFTNRTFRYLAEPRYPEGIDGSPPGPMSILQDGGANFLTGLNIGAQQAAGAYNVATNTWSAYNSAQGFNDFHPGTNFHEAYGPNGNPGNLANENGVVFFPGAIPLYKTGANGQPVLVGGLGVSGDGVDQDDVETFISGQGFMPPNYIRADQFFFGGVRLPFQKFDRNPTGGTS